MGKTELTVNIETERLDVLNYFLKQENTSAQKELQKRLTELYEQKVPAETRGYIDSRYALTSRPRRPDRRRTDRRQTPASKRESSASGMEAV